MMMLDGLPMLLELFCMGIGPDDLAAQLPVRIETLRQIPGPDHSGYWLARCEQPIHWDDKVVNYLVVAPTSRHTTALHRYCST